MTKTQLRGLKREPKEHVVDSRVVHPKSDFSTLNRGWMNVEEWPQLVGSIEEVVRHKVHGSFVEIGCKNAGSTRTIVQVLHQLGVTRQLISIDPDPKAKPHHDKVPTLDVSRRLLIGRSQDHAILVHVPHELAWVLIDGCHCYDCVKADIVLYAQRIQPGGIALLHDCDLRVQQRPKPSQPCGGRRKRVGVYDAMMKSPVLQESFYLLHFVEGALDPLGHYWNGLALWRRRE